MPSVACRIASTFSYVHKAIIFCVSGLVASSFSAVKALNCGFWWFASEGWDFIVVRFPSFFCKSIVNKLIRNKALQLASALCAYAGQSLSCRFAFAALIVMQNVNLKPAAELNVTQGKYGIFSR